MPPPFDPNDPNGPPWRCPRDHTCASTGRAHDDRSGYRHGCRSGAARDDMARDSKHRRLGRATPRVVDNTGTVRRLQALAALGWSSDELARRLGCTNNAVNALRRGANRTFVATAARIAALYDELSMTPGGCERTARDAARKRWAPPLCWDDDTLDDPAAKPALQALRRDHERPDATRRVHGRDPRLAVDVARLTRNGLSVREIADRLRCAPRTVTRVRGRLRDEGELDAA